MVAITEADLAECMGALNRFALTLTRNEDRAHDLVQDCVERCLRKQHLFDGRNLRSWMFTVCRRVFVNQMRREQSRGPSVDVDDAPAASLAVDSAQDERIAYRELLSGLSLLPVSDRDVLHLVAIQGLKYEEAAKILDVPVGTVRSRLSRARTRLRDVLETGEGLSTAPFALTGQMPASASRELVLQ